MYQKIIIFLRRVKRAGLLIANRLPAGRQLTILPDDVFIVSYPKSGNTWVRFLIGGLVSLEETISFANIEKRVPDIYQTSDTELLRIPTPRYIKSHEYFDPRYKKVIYIVRDPRDVLVSYYHHQIKFNKIDENAYELSRFADDFLQGRIDDYGDWDVNVRSWLFLCEKSDSFLLLRYEDLLNDPFSHLKKIAEFINIKCTDDKIKQVIAHSSADNMKSLEKQQSSVWKATKDSRSDKYFVRSATAGEWQNTVPAETAEKIVLNWKETMNKLGYF